MKQIRHPLDAYRTEMGLTLGALAEAADTTEASLSRIIRYKQRPSYDLIDRLTKATNGRLSPNDFFSAPVAEDIQ